jgi:prepilin-type N-terminal cleavage/methylation domain-containing protein
MNKRGFTLIEFVIYIAIVGIILVVAGAIGFNILFGKAKLAAIEEVSQNARFTMEKIADTVRNAQAINSPSIGTTAPLLSLQIADSSKNPTLFDVSAGTLRITEGVSQPVSLTASEVTATNLQFSNVSYALAPGTVRIQMTVQFTNPSGRPEYNFAKTFYTTANIRKK